MDPINDESSARFATEVLVAYLRRHKISAEDLPRLARDLRTAFAIQDSRELTSTAPILSNVRAELLAEAGEIAPAPQADQASQAGPSQVAPAVPIAESIHDGYLVSLEDGKHYRSLRRHLMAKYGMTPDDYRAKWGLPPDYPMVAPSYARDRSEVAKRSGLGLASTRKGSPRSEHA